jgi:hypothetical protein
MSAKGYVKRLMGSYERLFDGKKPKEWSSPIDNQDHPELDASPELTPEMVKIYQSLIEVGCRQT